MKIIFQSHQVGDVKLYSIQHAPFFHHLLVCLFLQPAIKESISIFMAHVHTSVNKASEKYQRNEKRYNYTTPKNFLEQIKLYINLLERMLLQLQRKMDRLSGGLEKLQSTAAQVNVFIV